jgi:hypothetical protein
VQNSLSEVLGFWKWLRSAPSKGPNTPLTWGRKQIQFPKRCIFLFLFRTMDKLQKPSVVHHRQNPSKIKNLLVFSPRSNYTDRLCGLVVRVLGYRSRVPGFDSRLYQIFWEGVGLERGPLSLVSTIEELLGRNSTGSGLENGDYGVGIYCADHATPSICKKLALTSQTSGGRSVDILRNLLCLSPQLWYLPLRLHTPGYNKATPFWRV